MKNYEKGITKKEKIKLSKEYNNSSQIRKAFHRFEILLYVFVLAGLLDILNEILFYIKEGALSNNQILSLILSFVFMVYILIVGGQAVKGSLSDYKEWLKDKNIKYQ